MEGADRSAAVTRPAPGARAARGAPLSESRRRMETARLLSRARASRGPSRRRYEDEVIALNMRVAQEVARRYHGRGIAAEDLDQVAMLGLVKAVRGFDPAQGEDFLSYAVPTVRGEVQRYFRDAGWAVRPPRSVQEVQARITAAEAELYQRLGRAPQPAELARHLEVPEDLVRDAQSAQGCFTPTSLDAWQAEAAPEDAPANRLGGLDPAFATTEARLALRPLMQALPERDRRIIELRFFAGRTQAQIGDEVGVSQEQVSRLITGILKRLRESLVA